MTQRADSPREITAPSGAQRTFQENRPIPRMEVTRMPPSITGRGHAAWTKPFAGNTLIQPQDGAADPRSGLLQRDGAGNESEDAQLTGETRSLDRRLQGLNIVQDYLKKENSRVTTPPARIHAEVA